MDTSHYSFLLEDRHQRTSLNRIRAFERRARGTSPLHQFRDVVHATFPLRIVPHGAPR
jgi:hypothetical protein